MAEVYRVTRSDGSVEFTDVPSGAGSIQSLQQEQRQRRAAGETKTYDHKRAEQLIREAQKRIPKIADYIEYLDYLRHNSPVRFDHVMSELRREDPQAWIKLQKHAQFRPLRETAFGLKAGTNLMSAGIGLASGKFAGSFEKWMETTVKSMMVRDRWGPFADVLGSKATTMPSKVAEYSNSRLGQYMRENAPKVEAASKAAAKELELQKAGMRAARGASITRLGGPVLDLGIGMLNPEVHAGAANWRIADQLKRALGDGRIDLEQFETAHGLFARGQYAEMQSYLDSISKSKRP